MLALKTRVETLLKAGRFDKAEVARRDLIDQEHHDRKRFAESLWRSWGCRRNKLAHKQSLERARCESDIASMKARFQADRQETLSGLERQHNFQAQCVRERYAKLNAQARTRTRNARLRLPPVQAQGGIPMGGEDSVASVHNHGDGRMSTFGRLRNGPRGEVLQQGWLFRKCQRSAARSMSAGKITGPEGRRVMRTRRSQSAGGQVATARWERVYVVMPAGGGLFLYKSEDAFASGQHAIAHVDLANGELRLPAEEPPEKRNYQPARLIFELVNVCITSCDADGERRGPMHKELRVLCLQAEDRSDYTAWHHCFSTCMRRHGTPDASATGDFASGELVTDAVLACRRTSGHSAQSCQQTRAVEQSPLPWEFGSVWA